MLSFIKRRSERARETGQASVDAAVRGGPVSPDATAAAFFDLDNTMLRGASVYWFGRGLLARKYFTSRDVFGFLWKQARFRWLGENAQDIADTKQFGLSFVAGREVSEIVALSEEIFDEIMVDRIWSGTKALADLHLRAGQQVWLVTAAPVELAKVVADRLGLSGALGTVAEIVDGKYTGRLSGDILHGPAKAEAVYQLAAQEGFDLATCTAYSDSANDIPMLSVVGRAVAVNPDRALRQEARQRGWGIRDFRTGRKAVIIGIPVAAGLGALAGAALAASAYRRRRRPLSS